ncbi:MAG: hypothetical protein PHQ96_06785 [Candidatus Omnitrophica bacterium]|nr:hypothetical protein [Candidatus Omnitrophota bacterium]
MLPSIFTTEEEIVKKLRDIARTHEFTNARTIAHVFYDVFKISYYALKRKKEGLKDSSLSPITLKRKEITRLVRLIDYHHSNDTTFMAEHDLTQCFGAQFTEGEALRFFDEYVEGLTKDRFGRSIHIDIDHGAKFMYKNPITGRHEVESRYYLPHRGKRLPWIKHTLHHSQNIYTRVDGEEREIMYICKYDLPFPDIEQTKCYWVVIVRKNRKDKIAPYNFRTAFPVFKYNNLLVRLERYRPIIEEPGV